MRTGCNVLLVDDDPEFSELAGEYLRGRGAEVWTARTIAQATELLGRELVEVLLVDLQLTDGDATQLLQMAKEREPPVATVVVTRRATVDAAVAALRAGAYDYMVKPVVLKELYQRLLASLQRITKEEEQRWSADAMSMLLCAELAESSGEAMACIHPMVDLVRRLPRADRVEVVGLSEGYIPTGAGRLHALGSKRGLLLDPDLPAARAVILAVHRALSRSRA